MISSEGLLTSAEKVAEDIVECYRRPPNDLLRIPATLGGLRSVARVYQRLSSRAAKHAGTLVTAAIGYQ
jgi:hypothetical protein